MLADRQTNNDDYIPSLAEVIKYLMDKAKTTLNWNKSSAVAEMGDRLATIGMGRKWGGAAVGYIGESPSVY